ncbi:glycoside hydrolase family 16 protein [Sporosarcina jiandibaonis]|uniref:glycoside hydrolase family 16 protein n=1 Tax=Sporosarcina jiandibaonis TaxID=2715535 RepID=UPI00155733A8|nr:glycoside hydrolase family 16 protein [Sporosarcina jiandibaonis]
MIKYFLLILLLFILGGCETEESLPDKTVTADEVNNKSETKEHDNEVFPIEQGRNRNEWTLVWNDEFRDESSLLNWNLQDWPSDKNGEWQYYSPANINVYNDMLRIESRKERYKGRDYTSGAVTTERIFEFTYGQIEIKAKIPKGKGVFPAFWLVNSNEINWLPEIDIMENLGQYPNELHHVVHWENSSGEKKRDYFKYTSEYIDFSEDFHIYGLLWEEDKIVWLVDGETVYETEAFSPNSPLFIYLNTAIGGFWPGEPDPLDDYPKEMLVDYVRVFQKKNGRQ